MERKELRILILEDVTTDAELIKDELREAGTVFTSSCVKDKASYLKALDEFSPDIILSDYSLPSFDGLSALKLAVRNMSGRALHFRLGGAGRGNGH